MFKQPRRPRLGGAMKQARAMKGNLLKNRFKKKPNRAGLKKAAKIGGGLAAAGAIGAGALALRKRGIRPGFPKRPGAIAGAARPRQLGAARPRQLTPGR